MVGIIYFFWETVESELMVFDIPNWTTMGMKNGWLERHQTEPPNRAIVCLTDAPASRFSYRRVP